MTVTCPYCGNPAQFVSGAVVYPHRDDLGDKQFWLCEPCWAYVGCHINTTVPLGRLANAELRKAKVAAHNAFDPLWRSKPQNLRSQYRKTAYKWLAGAMGMPAEQTHIGMFDVEQCAQVVRLCSERTAKAMATELMGDK